MSENSDAVVLVVSEETGIISLAVGGKITRNYNAVTATAELRKLLISGDNSKGDFSIKTALNKINVFTKLKKGNKDNAKD